MRASTPAFQPVMTITLILVCLFANPVTVVAQDDCKASGELEFICGPKNAEDLVQLPGTRWVIASGMAPDAAIYLIDSQAKSWTEIYPSDEVAVQHDREVYGACPGAPDPKAFVSHGLNLRPGSDGQSRLYVVGHGAREAIEVFDVDASMDVNADASGETPKLSWRGCVPLPEGQLANSVAALADGTLLVTVPVYDALPSGASPDGTYTGGVFRWSPGDAAFSKVEGTDLPYVNGIEVSADGQEFYVASSGLSIVVAFSNTHPAKELRRTEPFSIIPDNVHLAADGNLITAGMSVLDPVCGDITLTEDEEIDIAKIASCPRPFSVLAIDPKTMATRVVISESTHPGFSNATMALWVGDELWMGTFAGDRIAYRIMQSAQHPGISDNSGMNQSEVP